VRSNLDRNKAQALDIQSAQFGINRVSLIANIVLAEDGPVFNFFEASGGNRDVTLPANKRGAMVGVINYGAANSLIVKTPSGSTLATLQVSEGALFACSGQEWRWFAYNPTAYLDPSEISSPDLSITVTTVGNAITVEVNEAHVDHNTLFNYEADRHVAHSGVNISAGAGLSGGGSIAASRTLALDIHGLAAVTPELADELSIYDVSLALHKKITASALNAILDHNGLLNYSVNRHIDHTGVSIAAGEGLTGGGAIDSSRTISLAIHGLTSDTPIALSEFAFWDTVAGEHNKVTLDTLRNKMQALPRRSVTAAGDVTIDAAVDDVVVVDKTVEAATNVNFPTVVARIAAGKGILGLKNSHSNPALYPLTPIRSGSDTIDDSATPLSQDHNRITWYLPIAATNDWEIQ